MKMRLILAIMIFFNGLASVLFGNQNGALIITGAILFVGYCIVVTIEDKK